MTDTADVIVIGTGVIGTATAFELAKLGFRVLGLDRNALAGHGSTSGSCAIIRMHYSTLDGTAFAWEGYHYWRDWADYLEARHPNGLAEFRETGCLVMKTEANGHLEKHLRYSRELDCPCEEWSPAEITERLPIYSLDSYAPARRPEDPGFGEANGSRLSGAVFWPR
ncbi:MAG: FAD-dependent oxidoreductase, partial [Pseudomonadota bacterium]